METLKTLIESKLSENLNKLQFNMGIDEKIALLDELIGDFEIETSNGVITFFRKIYLIDGVDYYTVYLRSNRPCFTIYFNDEISRYEVDFYSGQKIYGDLISLSPQNLSIDYTIDFSSLDELFEYISNHIANLV
jgi:hypothetical protein